MSVFFGTRVVYRVKTPHELLTIVKAVTIDGTDAVIRNLRKLIPSDPII